MSNISVTPVKSASTSHLIKLIKAHYHQDTFIPLHAPCVGQAEKDALNACIDSTFVSSVGQFVSDFEAQVAQFTGAKHAVALVNGTLGLFLALKVLGVKANEMVLTQSLTFVATANAIKMAGAEPVFLDVDKTQLGLSLQSLQEFLATHTEQIDGVCVHKPSGRKIAACMPMHCLGFIGDIRAIVKLCHHHNIKVVEDAAESLGSFYQGQHAGTFADIGVFSFNGNKTITTGGGGLLITQNSDYAEHARHLSTTAKIPHPWLFEHDEVAFNLRMPNINAALGVAQCAKLPVFLAEKKALAHYYQSNLEHLSDVSFLAAPPDNDPNFWLMGVRFAQPLQRDVFLQAANEAGIQARPLWTPMHQLEIYKSCYRSTMPNTEWLAQRVVNIPSGVRCYE